MAVVIGSFVFTLVMMFAGAAISGIPVFYWLCFWAFFWIGLMFLIRSVKYYEQKYWDKHFEEYLDYYKTQEEEKWNK